MQEKSAGAVIFFKNEEKIEYLLLHYQAGHWDFPKGHIEKGEDLITTVRREVKEETGIEDIDFISGFSEDISYWFKKKPEWYLSGVSESHVPSHRIDGKEKGAIFKTVAFFLAQVRSKHAPHEKLPYQSPLGPDAA